MNHFEREIVRVGVSGACLLAVTNGRLDYIDMAGRKQFIDLEQCALSWIQWRQERGHEFLPLPGATPQSIAAQNARCVGRRGALDNPPWVEFQHERKIRFEFATREDLYRELLVPLLQAGWQTFDAN